MIAIKSTAQFLKAERKIELVAILLFKKIFLKSIFRFWLLLNWDSLVKMVFNLNETFQGNVN